MHRPAGAVRATAAWGGGKTNATTISLTPLSDEDTARLVGGLLDQALLPAEVQPALLERAEGNPLYAQEYVRMLQDRGLLVREAGGWTSAGEVVDLPESVQGIIAARLDTLTLDEKALIQDAAVVGKTAWVGAVCALSERAWQAEELLHGLERKQLLQRVRRSSIQGESEFQFGHALTKDVAYSQIRRADRAQKHEAAAPWIEQLAGERDDKAELLADHYTQALTLREALGEDTTPIAAQGARGAHRGCPPGGRHLRAYRRCPALTRPRSRSLPGRRPRAALRSCSAGDRARRRRHRRRDPPPRRVRRSGGGVGSCGTGRADARPLVRGHGGSARRQRPAWPVRGPRPRVPPGDTMCMIAYDEAYRLVTSGQPAQALALVDGMIPRAEEAGWRSDARCCYTWRGWARIDSATRTAWRTCGMLRPPSQRMRTRGRPRRTATWRTRCAAWETWPPRTPPTLPPPSGHAASHSPSDIDLIPVLDQAYQAYHAAHWDITRATSSTRSRGPPTSLLANAVRIVGRHHQPRPRPHPRRAPGRGSRPDRLRPDEHGQR